MDRVRRVKVLAIAAPIVLALLSACSGRSGDASASCDRSCLQSFVDQYLIALAAREPRHLPLARNVKFVENGQELQISEGTWKTVNGLGKYRHYFADPETGNVAAITVVEESGTPIIYDLRLKIEKEKIAEIESMAIRDPSGAARYEKLGKPLPVFSEPVSEDKRLSREELIATANKYFSGMENNDPNGDYSFFADDCNRREHARQTTNMPPGDYGHSTDADFVTMTCAEQFRTGFLGFVTRIRDRRFVVVDVERQSIFAFADLDHNGTVRSIAMSNGKTFPIPAYFDVPRTLQVGEAFRIDTDNKIKQIEMTLTELPYGMRPGFDSGDDWLVRGMNDKFVPAVPNDLGCDRDCLKEFVDKFLDALTTHDPRKVALAANIHYTENGQTLNLGDGLWGTATSVGEYKVYVTNPLSGEAGFFGTITQTSTPAILTFRLKVERNMITEIEVMTMPQESTGERGGTLTLFAPRLAEVMDPANFVLADPEFSETNSPTLRPTSVQLVETAHAYYQGIEQRNGSVVPFADDCIQRINGVTVTNMADAKAPDPAHPDFKPDSLGCAARLSSRYFSDIKQIRGKHPWVVDDESGLVLDLAFLDIPEATKNVTVPDVGEIHRPMLSTGPYTLMAVSLYKISDNKIERIESAIRPVPYGMGSGWE